MIEFKPFPKLARLNRNIVVTEKIDGTNAQVLIVESPMKEEGALDYRRVENGVQSLFAGSRTRFLTPSSDNFGFARWATEHAEELFKLGPGQHFGEWWGNGIQRGYGLPNGDKRFSLFNTGRWRNAYEAMLTGHQVDDFPTCCHVVPVLAQHTFDSYVINETLFNLRVNGSSAAPGFMNPEGVVVFLTANGSLFKVTLEHDGVPKSKVIP